MTKGTRSPLNTGHKPSVHCIDLFTTPLFFFYFFNATVFTLGESYNIRTPRQRKRSITIDILNAAVPRQIAYAASLRFALRRQNEARKFHTLAPRLN